MPLLALRQGRPGGRCGPRPSPLRGALGERRLRARLCHARQRGRRARQRGQARFLRLAAARSRGARHRTRRGRARHAPAPPRRPGSRCAHLAPGVPNPHGGRRHFPTRCQSLWPLGLLAVLACRLD
eukprot:8985056-Alexandrium_andersonii.AAC.1